MIKINLIAEGKKAVTRKAKTAAAAAAPRDLSQPLLAAGFLIGMLAFGVTWFVLNQRVRHNDEVISAAQREVEELQAIIKEVDDYKVKKAALEHKISVINALKQAQQGPVRIMDQVSRALPELLWLEHMEVIGSTITLSGKAFNTNAVANFIENLDKVPEFQEPILKDTAQQGAVYSFVITLSFNLNPPAKAGAAAGAAKSGG